MENTKLAYSTHEAAERAGVGITLLREAIRSKRLTAVKAGRRTLVPAEALASWLANLPKVGGGEEPPPEGGKQ